MPWVIGIDEAGYGPNLGPLVQAAVPLRAPDGDPGGWSILRSVVRRSREKADGRLLLDDSKKVYGRGGLAALELGVRSALRLPSGPVGELIEAVALPGVTGELAAEAWYEADESAPVAIPLADVAESAQRLAAGVPEGCGFGMPFAAVVPTPRFNHLCDAGGSKAAVLSRGLIDLIQAMLEKLPSDGERVIVHCDKHGGRNYYADMVQEAFPDGWLVIEAESAAESRYRVELLSRPVTVVFRPRADGESAAVAVSSMLSKYLREICMRQFNRFWARHLPGLAPTAGYPEDARRFFAAIQPVMDQLRLERDQVWRKR